MKETVYTVKVRPALVGFISSLEKKTLLGGKNFSDPDDPLNWMGWTPEPTYWRPTESWAIRRAARKRRRLMAKDDRLSQRREVHSELHKSRT